jgi:hypothetical protein
MYFKNVRYKTFSGPFDWLAADDIHMLDDILATNFSKFLDNQYLIDHVSGSDRQCGHTIYGSRFFHHYNPRHPETGEYYKRCIARFQSLSFCAPETVLCLLMIFYEPEDGMLERIHSNLKKLIPNESLEFLVCIVTSKSQSYYSAYARITPSFSVLRLHIKTNTVGIAFASQEDNLFFHKTLHQYYVFDIFSSPFEVNQAISQFEKAAAYDISL